MIYMHDWIIITIRKHIEANKSLTRGNICIRIEETSPSGVIVSALEVIVTGLAIVIVSAIAEGVSVEDGVIAGGVRCCGTLALGIVGIGTYFCSRRIVDCNYVALEIFLKEVIIESVVAVGRRAVHHAYRRIALVIQVDQCVLFYI